MDLPKNEKTFNVDLIGKDTGKKYDGVFTVRCILNIGLKHALEMEKTRLQGDFINPTDGLNGLAIILATLRTHIIDAPEWWKQSLGGTTIMDENVVVHIYDKILEAGKEWREMILKMGTAEEEKKEK